MTARRRPWLAGAIAITTAAAGAGSAYALFSARERHAERPATVEPAYATDTVTRMTLTTTGSVDGQLSRGIPEPVESKAAGTITWLPAVGALLRRGDAVLRADERPVILLYGRLPMYRPLAADVEGDDVAQFERNLAALGYAGFTVDRRFTPATTAAVKRWQRDLGVPTTGTVEVAAVVYAAGPVRVAGRLARLGATATGEVITCTPDTKIVMAEVPAAAVGWAVAGSRVTVELPNGRDTAGVVRSVGSEAAVPQDAGGEQADAPAPGAGRGPAATVQVTVSIADQEAIGAVTNGPVHIRHTVQQRREVLTVSVAALVAPIGGGYAVELDEGGESRLLPVTTGLFADGRVEIRGTGLAEGLRVRVPA
ncbi:peptidoglycan-binding protein [Micromonospora sp. PLK6-60]|uniref:peptidoglycan-binding domain-containing protein n=1 Tax=Micromonospora sp. PLK6-60 TaxID=2873383 RepID=UPI001CA791AD|nr:peptidoglycan-binding domain-containing protein [Micromonospora sp. PLK6-60]MBY8871339.1 peptidoglycan-binding protein [Micromonospora sp. PLK6-60]